MSDLHLTILGSSPSWPNPGSACSGYLVSAGDTHVLLDCGPGVVGRLREVVAVRQLAAVAISHMHPDHYLDLVSLRACIRNGHLGGDRPIQVLLPPGGGQTLSAVGQALDGDERLFADTFDLAEYDPAEPRQLGPLTIRFRRVRHYIPAYAMRVEVGTILTFSADAAPCEELVEHARGVDALLCESAIERAEQDAPDPERRGHMTATEAGELAARAGARRLLLTHAGIDPGDPERVVRQAQTTFQGPVERVRDGQRYRI